jgi:membrane-bound lytic murein transglycosylase B
VSIVFTSSPPEGEGRRGEKVVRPQALVSTLRQNETVATRIVRRNRTIAVTALVALVVILIVTLTSCGAGGSQTQASGLPVAAPLPPHDSSLTDASVRTVPLVTVVDEAWIAETSDKTGIPARALAAYAGGAVRLALTWPECGVTWNTLAGIGWVESHHGELFGDHINEDGFMSAPIFGQPLVGEGTMNIPDFDDGNFDGSAEFDRAVGPMQIIPQTWAAWNVDANGDGDPNGQQIDDSVVSSANYLCYSSETMTTAEGWKQSLWSYNQLDSYAEDVRNKANEYAAAIGVH